MRDRSDDRPVRARRPVTDAERARVAELHAQGLSRGAIARDLGRSADTVGRIAAAANLPFDRAQTKKATEAKQVDNRARRAVLIEEAYEQARAVIARMAAADGYDATGTATNGVTVVTRVALPPAHDLKALAGAFSTLTSSAARMEALDVTSGTEEAKGMLIELGQNLSIFVSEMDRQGPADG